MDKSIKYFTPPTLLYVGGVFMKMLFQEIVNHAINNNVSDIHFIPSEHHTLIKLRINDQLINYDTLAHPIYSKLLIYMKFKSGLDVSSQQVAQSGRYIYKLKNIYYLRILRFRYH